MNQLDPTKNGYYREDSCKLEDFANLIDRNTSQQDAPHATAIEKNVPIYDMHQLRSMLETADERRRLMSEWAHILQSGAGVVALKGAYADSAALDQATKLYEQIIEQEKAQAGGGADHFAASGANDRIWNSLQKLCEASPEVFLAYFANTAIAAICEAWLGPNYQMTAQVNLVHPGGQAQKVHRDYHLGFQTADICASYPAHIHDISPVLTLQGAVAHCDMPLESGPTKLLPFSQTYRAGYAAWRREDFQAFFEEHYIQLPLEKGDAVFFNPALFHAAGSNTSSDIHRFANLLQVSSAFGRTMETIDRSKMCKLLFPLVSKAQHDKQFSASELSAAIGAAAEGYSFPTNLDRDPPTNGLAPESQAAFFHRALAEGLCESDFANHIDHMSDLRQA